MDAKPSDNVSMDAMRELRNDFTFYVSMSLLKTMAIQTEDPKKFMRDLVWKWREMQITALGMAVSMAEKNIASDEEFAQIFGDVLKKLNKAQREVLVASIRDFCETIEKVLVNSMDSNDAEKESEEFAN